MAIEDDFSVATNGDIRHVSGTSHYMVLDLHRFLQDLADNASASGNDLLDITSSTPSNRSTDNIITLLGSYNIDDTAAEYLYDGSVKQGTGGTEELYSGLKVLGAVNNANTQLEVVQDNAKLTAFWGDQSTGGYNGDAAAGVLMRCLIKSRTSGADIDGKRIRVQARHWGDSYDFFNVTLGEGEAVAAIGTTPDAQNTTLQATVTAYTHVTNTEGYQLIDVLDGDGSQPYYSKWTYSTNDSGDKLKGVYEFIKDLTGNGTVKTIHGINGELFLGITHEYPFGTETGNPFVEDDVITWGSGATAGTGLLLALDDTGNKAWIQLLTGVAPANGMTVTNELADGTHDLTSAPTTRTVPKIFLGSFTGTLIGAFGIGILTTDLTKDDSVQDLLTDTHSPPNIVTFTVSGLADGEDYVLVGPKDVGLAFKFDQLTLQTTLDQSNETAVVVTASIPADTPSSGTIRILLDTGIYRRVAYSSWSGSTFNIGSTDFTDPNDATAPANVWISYIDDLVSGDDEISFQTIYNAPRDLYIRVRDGGGTPIKTFESPASLGIAGGGAVASRIEDV